VDVGEATPAFSVICQRDSDEYLRIIGAALEGEAPSR
jgi:hypothetical protein